MKLNKPAIAGTLESSDCQVTVSPDKGINIELESSVKAQFGDEIEAVVRDSLKRLGVEDAKVVINDKGALDCTIRSRVETAVFRSTGQDKDIPWEALQ